MTDRVKKVNMDFETFSEVNLKTSGAWVYAEHPSTEPICLCYWFDTDPDDHIRTWIPDTFDCEMREWAMPEDLRKAIFEDGAVIAGWNVMFEWVIWNLCLKWDSPHISQWEDTMSIAATHALPLALEKCALALRLKHQKDKRGSYLIQRLCKPVRGKRIRDPELLKEMYQYCAQDVRTERALSRLLKPMTPNERAIWELWTRMLIRGVKLDPDLIAAANDMAGSVRESLDQETRDKTAGLVQSTRKRNQVLDMLESHGVTTKKLTKQAIKDLLERDDIPPLVRELLENRLESTKASVAKYKKGLDVIASDERAHGMQQYHGATTGRDAGRLLQVQNFARPSFDDTEHCIEWILRRDLDAIELLWGAPMEALSSCLRGMITASPGCRLIVADYSAIEARAIAWLAGQEDLLEVFRGHGKIYEHTAGQIYGVPWTEIGKESMERFIGKVASLALGYQGGVGAFLSMAALYGVVLEEKFVEGIVKAWRKKNDQIVSFWYDLDRAAIRAVKNPGRWFPIPNGKASFACDKRRNFLYLKIPGGRTLMYFKPRMEVLEKPWGGTAEQVTHLGFDKKRRWGRVHRYGGSWAENVTQAFCRDLMYYAGLRLDEAGYPIVMTVHDEIVSDVPNGRGSFEEFRDIMCDLPEWAAGLPVGASGYEGFRFRK